MTDNNIDAISEISTVVIFESLELKESFNKNRDAIIKSTDLPKIALACCIGDDKEPQKEIQASKTFVKLNSRCDKPLSGVLSTILITETRKNLILYLDRKAEIHAQDLEEKRQKEIERRQKEI